MVHFNLLSWKGGRINGNHFLPVKTVKEMHSSNGKKSNHLNIAVDSHCGLLCML